MTEKEILEVINEVYRELADASTEGKDPLDWLRTGWMAVGAGMVLTRVKSEIEKHQW